MLLPPLEFSLFLVALYARQVPIGYGFGTCPASSIPGSITVMFPRCYIIWTSNLFTKIGIALFVIALAVGLCGFARRKTAIRPKEADRVVPATEN